RVVQLHLSWTRTMYHFRTLWQHRHLQLAVSVLHMSKQVRQLTQSYLAVHKIACRYFASSDRVQGFADEARRMVERRFDRNFRVVEQRRLELDFRAPRAAAEQINGSPTSHHLGTPLPRQWRADGFDDHVRSKLAVGQFTNCCHGIGDVRSIDHRSRTDTLCGLHLGFAFADSNHSDAAARQNSHNLQPDRPATNPDSGVAGARSGFLDTAQDAGQRFNQCGIDERKVIRNFDYVLAENAGGNQGVFRVRAVVE